MYLMRKALNFTNGYVSSVVFVKLIRKLEINPDTLWQGSSRRLHRRFLLLQLRVSRLDKSPWFYLHFII